MSASFVLALTKHEQNCIIRITDKFNLKGHDNAKKISRLLQTAQVYIYNGYVGVVGNVADRNYLSHYHALYAKQAVSRAQI